MGNQKVTGKRRNPEKTMKKHTCPTHDIKGYKRTNDRNYTYANPRHSLHRFPSFLPLVLAG